MSSTNFFAYLTESIALSKIFSLFELNLYLMCESDVPIPVWILGFFAKRNESAATSISFFTALVNPQTVAFLTIFDISTTEL